MENQNKNGNIIAIITMMFLYAMISFVTNLAAPIGVIWKNVFADSGSANMIGMLGNAMNFLAYLFMGIPAGKLLTKDWLQEDCPHRYCYWFCRRIHPVHFW